jgi:hypothetical protein
MSTLLKQTHQAKKNVILNRIKTCKNVPNKMNTALETVHTIDKNNSQTEN